MSKPCGATFAKRRRHQAGHEVTRNSGPRSPKRPESESKDSKSTSAACRGRCVRKKEARIASVCCSQNHAYSKVSVTLCLCARTASACRSFFTGHYLSRHSCSSFTHSQDLHLTRCTSSPSRQLVAIFKADAMRLLCLDAVSDRKWINAPSKC